MEITKESIVSLIGTTEGFSAEAVKQQLELRQKSIAAQIKRFRAFHELNKSVKK